MCSSSLARISSKIRAEVPSLTEHSLDAGTQPVDGVVLDGQVGLELLLERLADTQREQALIVGQSLEEQDPVGQALGVVHLLDRLGLGVRGQLTKPQLACIFACRKYWLIAVSSLVSWSFSRARTSGSPCTVCSFNTSVRFSIQVVMGNVTGSRHRLPDRGLRALADGHLERPARTQPSACTPRRHLSVNRGQPRLHHDRDPRTTVAEALLRSPEVFSWLDAAGVEEVPPIFAGQMAEKLSLADETAFLGVTPVVVAGIVPVEDYDRFWAFVQSQVQRLAAAGVRHFWSYRALDDPAEVMILHELETEAQAERYISHSENVARWMSRAGVGVYPPLFVGRLAEIVDLAKLG